MSDEKRDDKERTTREASGAPQTSKGKKKDSSPDWMQRDRLDLGTSAKTTSDQKAAAQKAEPEKDSSSDTPSRPSRRRRVTTETWRRSKAASVRKVLGLPIWGWLLIVVITISILFILLDLRNRSRYRLVCGSDHLELQQGRRLPWPFGFETVGGRFKRVAIPPDADCENQPSRSRTESESAFLDVILAEARRTQEKTEPGDLKKMRVLVLQALRITRSNPHRARRREAERALADIAYRQGRAGLSRVEHELRTSLGHLQEAQKRAADRYEDLEEWIEHLESLLRSVSPTPSGVRQPFGMPKPAPLPLPKPGSNNNIKPPSPSPDATTKAQPDAGPASPTPGAGGIVM